MASYFLNPALVIPGLALISLPIIIHLINRMRYRRVRFAAMEFLLQSDQRNRRRVLIEQLILLLLRILIVALIMFLLARLLLDPRAASVFRSAKTLHVILLDDSISMQTEHGADTAFDQAKQSAITIAEEGAKQPGRQRYTLVLLSDLEASLFEQRDVTDDFVEEVRSQLKTLKATHSTPSMSEGIEYLQKYAKQQTDVLTQFHVISNFRHDDWITEEGLFEKLADFDEAGLPVNLIRTIKEDKPNLSIDMIDADMSKGLVRLPIEITVAVTNHGGKSVKDVKLDVFGDGTPISIHQAGVLVEAAEIDELQPGQTARSTFTVKFRDPGWHQVQVTLPDDPLAADNSRFVTMELRDTNRILVIDGDPDGDENFYVYTVLDVLSESAEGVLPAVRGTDALRKDILANYSCIYLLNVADLAPDALKPLKKYVADGGGVVWYVGPQVIGRTYNSKLYENGEGLFPVPLEDNPRTLPSASDIETANLITKRHPIFDRFRDGENNPLGYADVQKYLPVAKTRRVDGKEVLWNTDDGKRADSVRTIATLSNGEPFVFDSTWGDGRVITILSTAGPAWGEFSKNPGLFPPFQLEVQKYVSKKNGRSLTKQVDDKIVTLFERGKFDEQVSVMAPGQKRPVELTATEKAAADLTPTESDETTSEDAGKEKLVAAVFTETGTPGIYSVVRKPTEGSDRLTDQYAMNAGTSQSNLKIASTEEMTEKLGSDSNVRIHEPAETSWLTSQNSDSDTRNLILFGLILLFVAEQFMSYRLSFHTR